MSVRRGGEARREATEAAAVVLSVAVLIAGFVYLPVPYGTVLLCALFGFVFVVAPPANAHAKGFRWWWWAVPNLIGWIAVLALPSARDPDVPAETRAVRARQADRVGAAQTAVTVVCLIAGLVRSATGWW
ncbi:MAG TPA: hypothetical protein VD866_18450 [Urbifossiella sp.]|nr:hypothetical protein [Urbifossiella sp.]